MTTLTALARPRVLFRRGPMRRGFLFGFLVTLLLGLLDGRSVGDPRDQPLEPCHAGRQRPASRSAASTAPPPSPGSRPSCCRSLTGRSPCRSTGGAHLPVADLNRCYDLEATVDAAFAVARSGNPPLDGVARLRTLAHHRSRESRRGPGPGGVDQVVSTLVAA